MTDIPTIEQRIVMRAKYDDDAKVWYVEHSDLFGVHAEGTTFDELSGKLPDVVRDLVNTGDILVEIIAHTSTCVKVSDDDRLSKNHL